MHMPGHPILIRIDDMHRSIDITERLSYETKVRQLYVTRQQQKASSDWLRAYRIWEEEN